MKPVLTLEQLAASGFEFAARWTLLPSSTLSLDGKARDAAGVYVFAKNGLAMYVGVASVSLARRLYLYAHPGPTQRTNLRLNALLRAELLASRIDVYTACPPDFDWHGLPIDGSSGLERGLIKTFALPWNTLAAS